MSEADWTVWVPLWFFSPMFVAIAWTDFSQMRIPNLYCWIGLAVFVVTLPALTIDDILLRVLSGVICFAICFGLFAARWLGGGDAKILPVVVLLIPPPFMSTFMLLLAAAMAVGLLGLPLVRRFAGQSGRFVSLSQKREFPMGIAIGSAGVVLAAWAVFIYF